MGYPEGIDYSAHRPSPAAIRAAGKAFVFRYAPYGGYPKELSVAELLELRRAGLAVGLVFESTANRPMGGRAAGRADGELVQAAIVKLSWPRSRPVYFAVDYDARGGELLHVDDYLRGAAEVIGLDRVGVYGSYTVVEHCASTGTARWFWQTYAWSGGLVSDHAHVLQYRNGQALDGAAVDFDRALRADYGAWAQEVTVAQGVRFTPRAAVAALTVAGSGHFAFPIDDAFEPFVPLTDGQALSPAIGVLLDQPLRGGLPGEDRTTAWLVRLAGRPCGVLNKDVTSSAVQHTLTLTIDGVSRWIGKV